MLKLQVVLDQDLVVVVVVCGSDLLTEAKFISNSIRSFIWDLAAVLSAPRSVATLRSML